MAGSPNFYERDSGFPKTSRFRWRRAFEPYRSVRGIISEHKRPCDGPRVIRQCITEALGTVAQATSQKIDKQRSAQCHVSV
jgi:hypothetical protein